MPTSLSGSALNDLSARVLGGALAIHRAVGPGLLERAYLACLLHELHAMSLQVETQVPIPLVYKGARMPCGYRADIVVERALLVEVKALESVTPLHRQQLYTYLRLGDYRLGLLLNFGAATMKAGITRVVNGSLMDERGGGGGRRVGHRKGRRGAKIAKSPAWPALWGRPLARA